MYVASAPIPPSASQHQVTSLSYPPLAPNSKILSTANPTFLPKLTLYTDKLAQLHLHVHPRSHPHSPPRCRQNAKLTLHSPQPPSSPLPCASYPPSPLLSADSDIYWNSALRWVVGSSRGEGCLGRRDDVLVEIGWQMLEMRGSQLSLWYLDGLGLGNGKGERGHLR